MGIINREFMFSNKTGRKLYEEFAENQPIIDYHCHLQPEKIANDYRFKDAYDLFLGGDHYKWRQMRSFGIDEAYITGDADNYEKWLGFAKTMPFLIGNPLYHWTALELKRYFDIDEPLTEHSAKAIWEHCNKKIGQTDFSARTLIERSNVQALCTTDDPADSLIYHKQLQDEKWGVSVLPTFRPDKAVNIDAVWFEGYLKDNGIADYDALVAWLKNRIAFFHEIGCRLSDHALDYVPYAVGNAREILEKKLSGAQLTITEIDAFKTAVLQVCAAEYARLGWAMQLHIGAMRNNNSVMFKKLGPDTGFDSINDREIAEKLSAFLNSLESEDCLPKTILYTLNPKDNFVLGTMLGNFQKGPTPSKIQFGSGWWFNDHRDGMEEQLQALANLGVLGKFVGMLTDSRSFVSYPRHEYFRRIFCNLIGKWVENGEYPNDREALGTIVRGVCHDNAEVYFAFDK